MYRNTNKQGTDYNAFNVYRRELAPSTVSLTGDRAQGDDSKHWANISLCIQTDKLATCEISFNILANL